MSALAAFNKPEVREALLKLLESKSYRNELASAAILAMRLQDDPAYIVPLRVALAKRESEFTSQAFGRSLGTLAYLARNEEQRDDVREFLVPYVNHKKRNIQVAALNALGTLGDPKAIPVVETFVASKETPQRTAAERALADLRAGRRPVDDFKNLRTEVLDLQKQNRALKKQVDALEKKLEALSTKTATPGTKPPTRPTTKSPKTK